MPKHISFPSIEAFRNVVKEVSDRATYTGKNDEGFPLFNKDLPKPTLTFTGSVKLHGTNGGVCFNNNDGLWAQSREQVITPEADNAGFAAFVHSNKEVFKRLVDVIATEHKVNLDETSISIYGEWAGKGVQKGVGITELSKAFYIFGVKLSPIAPPIDESSGLPLDVARWVSHRGLNATAHSIYNVLDYQTYELTVNFENPGTVTEILNELTLGVENECPIAKAFGVSGVGEGIVFTTIWNGKRFAFKSKGEKHSVTAPKTKNAVDIEKQASLESFAEYAVTPARIEQAVNTINRGASLSLKDMGNIIKWVNQDVLKEETDTLEASGFTSKEVSGVLSTRTRKLFSDYLDSQSGVS